MCVTDLDLWKMFGYLNLVNIFYRIKSKLDQGGVIQDFINALDQLSNPDLLFKVTEQLLTRKTICTSYR